jgi:hypothetical protein
MSKLTKKDVAKGKLKGEIKLIRKAPVKKEKPKKEEPKKEPKKNLPSEPVKPQIIVNMDTNEIAQSTNEISRIINGLKKTIKDGLVNVNTAIKNIEMPGYPKPVTHLKVYDIERDMGGNMTGFQIKAVRED